MGNGQDMDRLKGCLEDYLRQKGLPTRKAFRCLHPEHEDKHPSMHYNKTGRNVHCFSCGITYDLFDLIGMDYGIAAFPERLKKAAELFGLPAPGGLVYRLDKSSDNAGGGSYQSCEQELDRGKNVMAVSLPPVDQKAAELDKLRQAAMDGTLSYLKARGISAELIRKYDLFQLEERAYFPVWEGGRCTGWCARAVQDATQPKYKNSAGSLGLWNGDLLACHGRGERLYITEGVIDALTLEQTGRKAVALCGSQNTAKLLRRCKDLAGTASSWRYVLCGDGDEAGERMNAALKKGLLELGLCVSELRPEGGDWNELYLQDRDKLLALLASDADRQTESESVGYNATSASAALDAFFAQREERAGRDAIPTGFSGLDKLLDGGLYPGLYVMGAISSLGKTSLALQVADHIAANDRDVLFISLEQSRFELMAKSLSRLSADLAGEDVAPFTARQLLSGEPAGSMLRQQLLADCREAYATTAAGLFLREGMADIGATDIRRMVREHIEHRGQAPVVVVDYLQILAPADPRAGDKQNTDRAVVELKRLSRDFDIPVIAISSFNRENYKAAVSMEAFKESGAVEYSADVLLGLQLFGAGGRDFDANAAKLAEPRQLELVILKNRNGTPYARLRMEYGARHNRFKEGKQAFSARYA